MELKYLKTDEMLINPKDKAVVSNFADKLGKKAKDIKLEIDVECTIRYILLMYDPRSPLIETIDDYWTRKFDALETAGFRIKNNKLEPPVEDMALGGNDVVNNLILDYLILIAKPQFSYIIFLQESLLRYTYQSNRTDKMSPADVKAAADLYAKLGEAVQKWLYMTQSENEIQKFIDMLYYRVGQELLKIRPEDYAKKISGGSTLDDDSPYGNYKPKKPKFVDSKLPDYGEEEE